MPSPVDASFGEGYRFQFKSESFTAIFVQSKLTGDLVFDRMDDSGCWLVDRETFSLMLCRGDAIKAGAENGNAIESDFFGSMVSDRSPGDTYLFELPSGTLKATFVSEAAGVLVFERADDRGRCCVGAVTHIRMLCCGNAMRLPLGGEA